MWSSLEVKEVLIVSGLIGVQVIYAVYMVFLDRVLNIGLNPLCLVIFGSLATSLMLLPFAVTLERKKWPTSLSPAMMVQFGLLALGGVTAFQAFMLLGIKKTSPAVASAMPNLAPGLIFIIAASLRFEKFELRCKYSLAKILGTLVCLVGAIAMSFLQSPPTSPSHPSLLGATVYKDWIIGCFYLLASVVMISCTTVLQAATMVGFPAPFSLCVITSLMGSIFTALMQIIAQGKLDFGSPVISTTSIIAIMLLLRFAHFSRIKMQGGVVTSVCIAFQTWCVNQKGPVLVSIFSPIQTICSAILSAVILKQVIGLGSLGGMLLMFIGLYIILWAKKKEGCSLLDADDMDKLLTHDVEKPLLS